MTIGEVIELVKAIFGMLMEIFEKYFGSAGDDADTPVA